MHHSYIPPIGLEGLRSLKKDMSIRDAVSICDDFALPVGLSLPFKLPFTSAVICIEGNFSALINQQSLKASRGDIIITQYGSIVEELTTSDDLKTISMVFMETTEGNLFNRPAEELGSWLVHRSIPVCIHLEDFQFHRYLHFYSLVKELYEESIPDLKEEIVKGFISLSVASFLSVLQTKTDGLQPAKPRSRQDEVFLKFKDDLQLYAGRERSVQFYADRQCISAKHFSRLIRLSSGKLPMKHIRQHVIIEAKTLLRATEMTIQEIADQLNFPSDSFFCRYFRQDTGLSPTTYRNLE